MDEKKKKLIQEKIRQVKEKKKLGDKKGKNVSKPKQSKKRADASKIDNDKKTTVAVGPKGGTYAVTSDGKKEYNVKKAEEFINQFKREKDMSDIKKAVDSTSADVDNGPKDEATMNAETAPSIQEATTPSKEAAPVEEPVVEAKKEEAPAPAPAPEEVPEPVAAKQELDFDGLFADDQFQVGSTLAQDPRNGGNVMTNMKKPQMDYVDRAKNHKNVSFTKDEMESGKGK